MRKMVRKKKLDEQEKQRELQRMHKRWGDPCLEVGRGIKKQRVIPEEKEQGTSKQPSSQGLGITAVSSSGQISRGGGESRGSGGLTAAQEAKLQALLHGGDETEDEEEVEEDEDPYDKEL